jgi:hypothetical protein
MCSETRAASRISPVWYAVIFRGVGQNESRGACATGISGNILAVALCSAEKVDVNRGFPAPVARSRTMIC